MDDWLDGFARALREELRGDGAVHGVDEQTQESLLELARVVAHGAERRFAPLSTFLAGQYVAARVKDGATPLAAAEEARAIAERLVSR